MKIMVGFFVLMTATALSVSACGNGTVPAAESAAISTATCWDGSESNDGNCPELKGQAAMKWIVPGLKSGLTLGCSAKQPTEFSPVATSEEIEVCGWPERPNVHLNVEHYANPQVAASGCYRSDDWVVDGKKFGGTGYTASDDNAERWWCYDDSGFVLNLTGPPDAVQSLSEDLVFRTAEEMHKGHS